MLVQDRRRVVVLERLSLHHVTPVARRVPDRQEDRHVALAGRREGGVAPRVPVHGVRGMLQQVRARRIPEPVPVAIPSQSAVQAAMRPCRCLRGMNDDAHDRGRRTGVALTHELTLACRGHRRRGARPRSRARGGSTAAEPRSGRRPRVERDVPPDRSASRGPRCRRRSDPGGDRSSSTPGRAPPPSPRAPRASRSATPTAASSCDGLRRAAAGELVLPAAHLAALVDLVEAPPSVTPTRPDATAHAPRAGGPLPARRRAHHRTRSPARCRSASSRCRAM